jgi:hypothetical protein
MSKLNIIGASNHCKDERETHDYYATDPIAAKILCEVEQFSKILEPACGEGHLSKEMIRLGYDVTSSDAIYRGYGIKKNFFSYIKWNGDIVTNPPFKYAEKFIHHGLRIINNGNKLCLFLKLQFLEGKARKELFQIYPPKTIYVSSSRIMCAKNGNFNELKSGTVIAYAWYVWEKGYKGNTTLKWIN